MSTLLTSKGQVTVPKPFRDYLGLKPGSAVEFAFTSDGQVIIKPAEPDPKRLEEARQRFRSVRGSAKLGMSTDAYLDLLRGYSEGFRCISLVCRVNLPAPHASASHHDQFQRPPLRDNHHPHLR
jgi:antitoxin PrlF